MKFPNAAKGVKRIFTAEILKLIATVLMIIAIMAMIVTLAAAQIDSEGGTIAAGISTVIFIIAATVIALIGGIMALVGIINASKDENSFKVALVAVIVSLCSAIVAGIFSNNATVMGICRIVQNLMSIITTVFVITGVSNLAVKVGNSEVAQQGKNLLKIIVAVYVLSLIANILALVFGGMFASITAGVIAVVALLLELVAYILYLSLLNKGKKMLAE